MQPTCGSTFRSQSALSRRRLLRSPTSIDEPQPGLRTYRVFHLGHDGAVRRAEILEAETDDAAKAIAATLPNGHGIDLWERARFLASYPPLSATCPMD